MNNSVSQIYRAGIVKLISIVQPTRCTCYLKLFILVKRSTCFRRSFRPSSGAQNCVYSNGICQTDADIGDEMELQVAAAVWHIPLLYTQFWAPDDGWKDRPKHVERFTKINRDNRCILLVVLLAAGSSNCLTYTVTVYAVLSSWWWTEKPPETCTAFYKNK